MAKKRKLISKSNLNAASEQPNPALEEDEEVEYVEEEEEDLETTKPSQEESADDDDEEEPISKLLEPLTKDQLIELLSRAAESHANVASSIKKVANEDTAHRKIFVHGLEWDATVDTLREAFSQYGEIEDCKVVCDKATGKSKGYGFVLFKTRAMARNSLKETHKKIGNRTTACQLAAMGPVQLTPQQPPSEYTQRKIYVSNVSADIDPNKLTAFFKNFGEIEEGPLGLDKQTGRPNGFCLFVYKSIESSQKALEEPHKHFEGHVLHCQKAIDGPKSRKQRKNDNNPQLSGTRETSGVPFSPTSPALNPALEQALTALLASQGTGLGLNNLLGTLGTGIRAPPVGHGIHGGYGSQPVGGGSYGNQPLGAGSYGSRPLGGASYGGQPLGGGSYGNQPLGGGTYGNQPLGGGRMNPGGGYGGIYGGVYGGVYGGYGTQGGSHTAYPYQQIGQGGSGRAHRGHMGGVAPYSGQ